MKKAWPRLKKRPKNRRKRTHEMDLSVIQHSVINQEEYIADPRHYWLIREYNKNGVWHPKTFKTADEAWIYKLKKER